MSVTVTLNDVLASQLASHAKAQNLTLEDFALQVLDEAVGVNGQCEEWPGQNRRRVELIHRSFVGQLSEEEANELERLQALTDKRLEGFDSKMLEDLRELEEKARQVVDDEGN